MWDDRCRSAPGGADPVPLPPTPDRVRKLRRSCSGRRMRSAHVRSVDLAGDDVRHHLDHVREVQGIPNLPAAGSATSVRPTARRRDPVCFDRRWAASSPTRNRPVSAFAAHPPRFGYRHPYREAREALRSRRKVELGDAAVVAQARPRAVRGFSWGSDQGAAAIGSGQRAGPNLVFAATSLRRCRGPSSRSWSELCGTWSNRGS